MLSIFGNLWKPKQQPEPLPPRFDNQNAPPTTTGEQLLYKMKYDGTNTEDNRRKGLIRLRRIIKEHAGIGKTRKQLFREEISHRDRAKTPLFEDDHELDDGNLLTVHQRARFLAYAYLRKRPYWKVETTPRWKRAHPDRPEPDWDQVARLIFRYGNFNEFLLSSQEVELAHKEQLDLLRKWAGN